MLIEAEEADFAALVAGQVPRGLKLPDSALDTPDVLRMLGDIARDVRAVFAPSAWLIVEGSEVLGLCSVMCVPQDGAIDIGYGIAPTRRGRGAASRAVAAVLAWATTDARVTSVTAATSVQNPASRRVLERNGFAIIGARTDPEDGELILWCRALKTLDAA